MKKLHYKLFLTILIVIATLTSCQSLITEASKKPKVTFNNMAFVDSTLTATKLIFTLTISNPYSFSLPIDAIDYHVTFNKKPFIAGSLTGQGNIKAHSKKQIQVAVYLRYQDIISSAIEILTKPKINYKLQAIIKLSAVDSIGFGGIRIPFVKNGLFRIPGK